MLRVVRIGKYDSKKNYCWKTAAGDIWLPTADAETIFDSIPCTAAYPWGCGLLPRSRNNTGVNPKVSNMIHFRCSMAFYRENIRTFTDAEVGRWLQTITVNALNCPNVRKADVFDIHSQITEVSPEKLTGAKDLTLAALEPRRHFLRVGCLVSELATGVGWELKSHQNSEGTRGQITAIRIIA